MSIASKLFGTHSDRELKKITPTINRIEDLEQDMQKLSDEELKAKTAEFKERLSSGETLDDILPEAFAVVREASVRTLGQRPFRVQLMGGIILHQGRIAEMKTGEGKTLVATMPAYLNALTGKGVHIVTVNDYLAKRDSEWMGVVYEFLGLTVGVVLNGMSTEERKKAYDRDITYITNNELGFDYLRDNMAVTKNQIVQRGMPYAIIDEVDSVLIDEARTPLIISGQSEKSTKLYEACDTIAKRLQKGEASGEFSKMNAIMGEEIEETGDFIVDEKEKHITLTDEGVKKVEQFFHLGNLADPENLDVQHGIQMALRANYLMFRDQDYVVKDDEVLIVDEFTGRIMPGRRYSDGLHQAIEAKEHVKVKRESKTLATITFQNFFNKYEKKAGMTGTALTEEEEFREIYGMDVVEIPTNKPMIRVDKDDAVYKTKREKFNAVCDTVEEAHQNHQPVLIGTINIDTSEMLSKMLSRRGIKHNVLNAKYHEKEAEIIAHAGEHDSVTIATNMAGRGTDIQLDDEARDAGGLKIIGTERHEARRIDNQLRGRSGRQGDPGDSQFFISLEDDLMRLFGSDKMMGVFNALGVEDGEQIHHKALSNAIASAQQKIENNNFGIRKNLLEYDQVMNEQREIIYDERRQVLNGDDMHESVLHMIRDFIDTTVDAIIPENQDPEDWNLEELNVRLHDVIPYMNEVSSEETKNLDQKKLTDILEDRSMTAYKQKETEFPEPGLLREVERMVMLRAIDNRWMTHIDDMDQLRQGIGLQAYGNKDPKVEYRITGFDMFEEMTNGITEDVVRILFSIKAEQKVEQEEAPKAVTTNRNEESAKTTVKRKNKKIYPNDPCPCGSGKKYKYCCGRNV